MILSWFYLKLCFASPGLYGRIAKADQVSFTEMRVSHFRSEVCKYSQPLSRVRYVWIFVVPLGKKINNMDSGLRNFNVLRKIVLNSTLIFTMIWHNY